MRFYDARIDTIEGGVTSSVSHRRLGDPPNKSVQMI